MEPFAQHVRDDPEITGATFGGEEHVVALFADDAVVALENPLRALLAFLKEVETFGEVSDVKINLSKSQPLSLTLPKDTMELLGGQYPFQ
ncbi:hypothetical protein NDU88_002132 [Pleurodeles waltl]|uniref:Reverse transcriptase domain-containing protein n=1 Tax=Pleurodeles waltl TaxID=8319 RepID=A0AAV7UW31_PLEWA|nr:hypothetical protein NDU88_002132 [Pleurodeles waltl]